MIEHYDFDNDGARLVGPDGIYVLASEYEKVKAALRACVDADSEPYGGHVRSEAICRARELLDPPNSGDCDAR